MIVGYISLGVAIISLLLGIYNWNQSILRLRADTKIHHTTNDCWAVETVVSNTSSRAVTILNSKIVEGRNNFLEEAEIRDAKGFYVFMHNGDNVGMTKSHTTYPLQIKAYDACEIERVVTRKPDKKARLVIETPKRTFSFKLNVPE